MKTILVIGATGSIGQLVVKEAVAQGYAVRALVRNARKAHFDAGVELFEGDLTQPETLRGITANIDGIIFTQGNYANPEGVDYGGVLNVLRDLQGRTARIALMSTIYAPLVSNNASTDKGRAWKRRMERVVRASQLPYTIVRPSWFDCNEPNAQQLFLTQGRTDYNLTAADGGVFRVQLAETLVKALSTPEALNKTVELFAEKGERTTNFNALFAPMLCDEPNENFDAVKDPNNRPIAQEPARVKLDLHAFSR
ncbi:SDR family oxidoreductase [Aggregatibacter kilianii]|uniref:SDR family oxidoreductase n=1 Tax=Aggregatibacter kilianii TaxID=2025884 RepID=UPI000D657EDF|nr:SDR family oxidoreductase [Aggregatibacter kilianii]